MKQLRWPRSELSFDNTSWLTGYEQSIESRAPTTTRK